MHDHEILSWWLVKYNLGSNLCYKQVWMMHYLMNPPVPVRILSCAWSGWSLVTPQQGPGIQCILTQSQCLTESQAVLAQFISLSSNTFWEFSQVENLLLPAAYTLHVVASHPSTHNSSLFFNLDQKYCCMTKGCYILGRTIISVLYSFGILLTVTVCFWI